MKRLLFLFLFLGAGVARADPVREGSLATSATGLGASVLDTAGGYAFFVDTGALVSSTTYTIQTNQIIPLQLATFRQAFLGILVSTFSTVVVPAKNAAVSAGGNDYFVLSQSSSAIVQTSPLNFTQFSSATLPSSVGPFSCGVIDPTTSYAYFGTDTNPAQIVKIDLSNLAVISSITLPSPNANLRSAAIDSRDHFAYFGSSTTPGNIAKINLSNFSLVNTLTFAGGEGAALSAFLDVTAGYLWVGTSDSPGKVLRIQLNTFQLASSLTLDTNENRLTSVVYDAGAQSAYFGTDTSTGIVVQVNPVGMKRIGSLMLNAGEAYLETAVMDANQYGYFGTMTNPGVIVKVDLIGGVPVITSIAPPEQDVSVGQSATFNVTATGRSLSYQWNQNGVPISGATQTTYQLTNTTLNDDGLTFTCTVSNSFGSATSGGTVLTVDPDIQVYPNPWRANRHAGLPVSFNEVPTGATVEIFTLAAQWVRTIPETNNIATWDLRNNAGQNAASGYYFYYVKTLDDRHTLRGKFAIIR